MLRLIDPPPSTIVLDAHWTHDMYARGPKTTTQEVGVFSLARFLGTS